MLICDADLHLLRFGFVRIRGVAAARILVPDHARDVVLVRGRNGRWFGLMQLDGFREGEEHPSVAALLGKLRVDGRPRSLLTRVRDALRFSVKAKEEAPDAS